MDGIASTTPEKPTKRNSVGGNLLTKLFSSSDRKKRSCGGVCRQAGRTRRAQPKKAPAVRPVRLFSVWGFGFRIETSEFRDLGFEV